MGREQDVDPLPPLLQVPSGRDASWADAAGKRVSGRLPRPTHWVPEEHPRASCRGARAPACDILFSVVPPPLLVLAPVPDGKGSAVCLARALRLWRPSKPKPDHCRGLGRGGVALPSRRRGEGGRPWGHCWVGGWEERGCSCLRGGVCLSGRS